MVGLYRWATFLLLSSPVNSGDADREFFDTALNPLETLAETIATPFEFLFDFFDDAFALDGALVEIFLALGALTQKNPVFGLNVEPGRVRTLGFARLEPPLPLLDLDLLEDFLGFEFLALDFDETLFISGGLLPGLRDQ